MQDQPMSDQRRREVIGPGSETPSIEVRVFRDGKLISRELCESEEDAALVVEEWSEVDGVAVEVDDLTIAHGPGDILAPEPPERGDSGYPDARETS